MTDGRGAGQKTHFLTKAYQRFREVIHEGAKFLIVGGTGVVVVLVEFETLLHFELGLGKFTAVTIATVVATIMAFLGNRYWSFAKRQGGGTRIETIMFFLLNGVGLLIQYGMHLLGDGRVRPVRQDLVHAHANLVGIGIGTLFRVLQVLPQVDLESTQRKRPAWPGGRHRKSSTSAPEPKTNPSRS